jgi:hypothetical protein
LEYNNTAVAFASSYIILRTGKAENPEFRNRVHSKKSASFFDKLRMSGKVAKFEQKPLVLSLVEA